MKLVLDTNIYIAAFLNKGLASQVLKLAQKGKLELYVSPAILNELEGKLQTKFKIGPDKINQFTQLILMAGQIVYPVKKHKVVQEDPDDNILINCAVQAQANLIVSMDKHLTKLKQFENIGIIHPTTLTWILPHLF